MGITGLRKIQIGEEGTKGLAVPTTAILLGSLTMERTPTIHKPREERAQMAEFSRSVTVGDLVAMTYEGDATFEQIIYLLHMGILGNVTPAVVDTSAKLWTFTPAMAAVGVYDSFTLEYGDDVRVLEAEYCMASRIEISGAMNAPVTCRADIFGRQVTVSAFTGALTAPTVETAIGQKSKLYIDAEAGTIGTTEQAATLIAWSYVINTGLYPKRYGDGQIYFSSYGESFKSVELRATFAFNAAAEVQRILFDGATQQLFRIETSGSLVGAVSAVREITLDVSGIYDSFSTLRDRDGEDVVEIVVSSQRCPTYTKAFEVAVQNAVAPLP